MIWKRRDYALKGREFLENEKEHTWGTLRTLSQLPIYSKHKRLYDVLTRMCVSFVINVTSVSLYMKVINDVLSCHNY
jgi:hypothetical protein